MATLLQDVRYGLRLRLEESRFYQRSGAFPGFGRGREHRDF
jgi:hypothetical protein